MSALTNNISIVTEILSKWVEVRSKDRIFDVRFAKGELQLRVLEFLPAEFNPEVGLGLESSHSFTEEQLESAGLGVTSHAVRDWLRTVDEETEKKRQAMPKEKPAEGTGKMHVPICEMGRELQKVCEDGVDLLAGLFPHAEKTVLTRSWLLGAQAGVTITAALSEVISGQELTGELDSIRKHFDTLGLHATHSMHQEKAAKGQPN